MQSIEQLGAFTSPVVDKLFTSHSYHPDTPGPVAAQGLALMH